MPYTAPASEAPPAAAADSSTGGRSWSVVIVFSNADVLVSHTLIEPSALPVTSLSPLLGSSSVVVVDEEDEEEEDAAVSILRTRHTHVTSP